MYYKRIFLYQCVEGAEFSLFFEVVLPFLFYLYFPDAKAGPGPVSQLPSKSTTGPTAATSPSPSLTSSSSSTAGPTSGPTALSAKGAKQG